MHAVLIFKLENKWSGCINRDKNGVKNIRKLALEYLKYGTRSHNYRRGIKVEDLIPYKSPTELMIKDSNPIRVK